MYIIKFYGNKIVEMRSYDSEEVARYFPVREKNKGAFSVFHRQDRHDLRLIRFSSDATICPKLFYFRNETVRESFAADQLENWIQLFVGSGRICLAESMGV